MSNSKFNGDILNAVITHALREDCERETAAFKTEDSGIDNYVFGKKIDKAVAGFSKNLNSGKSNFRVVFRKVGAVAAACFIFFSIGAMPNVSAYANNILVKAFTRYDEYTFNNGSPATDDFTSIKVNWLPAGYSLKKADYEFRLSLVYKNNSGDEVFLKSFEADGTELQIDSEHYDITTVSVNGNPAYFYKSQGYRDDNSSMLVWESNGHAFMITSVLPEKDIVKIAENVSF